MDFRKKAFDKGLYLKDLREAALNFFSGRNLTPITGNEF